MSYYCKDICPLPCNLNVTVTPILFSNNFLRRRILIENHQPYTSVKIDNNPSLATQGLKLPPDSIACKDMVELLQFATSPNKRGGTRGQTVICKYHDVKFWGSAGS